MKSLVNFKPNMIKLFLRKMKPSEKLKDVDQD